MPETSRTICEWGDVTFGKVVDLRALVGRARQEMNELEEAIGRNDPAGIGEEAADAVILLHRLAGCLGLDLSDAVNTKMTINRARLWTAAGDGTGAHV